MGQGDPRGPHQAGVRLIRSSLMFYIGCSREPASACRIWGHVWTAPSWQELSSRLQRWSVQPCVRPLDAVHMTAGHNALRGSGPDQKLAFDNALTQVGCPDRRIDRLCITCCSPSQPSHHAGCPARSFTPQARRVPCSARPWPSSPRPSVRSCWQARWRRPSSAVSPTMT
jgi:hypothetical protein